MLASIPGLRRIGVRSGHDVRIRDERRLRALRVEMRVRLARVARTEGK